MSPTPTALRAEDEYSRRRVGWWRILASVWLCVGACQLWLVARAGTDIPFHDQWDVEGRWLYPAWLDGTLRFAQLFQPHNEHRIVWTYLLDLGLFWADRQWDPLVQMLAGVALRATIAAVLVALLGSHRTPGELRWLAVGIVLAFLPHLAWHNALWGFQSQVYFTIFFSVTALALLGSIKPGFNRQLAGLLTGAAALMAMGAGGFVPVALFGMFVVKVIEQRRLSLDSIVGLWPAFILLALAGWLRTDVPEHLSLRATSFSQALAVMGRILAWPHVDQPWAAIGLNLPLAAVIGGRLLRVRRPSPGEDMVCLLGFWALANAVATSWIRGGGDELLAGVPSRYVDFAVLLPIANAACVAILLAQLEPGRIKLGRLLGAAWLIFLVVGWLGLSVQTMHGVILPRMRDPQAPVVLAKAFQATDNPAVFDGQSRLLVPHPNPTVVHTVLHDVRMRDVLPPSLNPAGRRGPLSILTREILARANMISTGMVLLALFLAARGFSSRPGGPVAGPAGILPA